MLMYCRIDLTYTEKPHPCATPLQGGIGRPFIWKKTNSLPFRQHHFSNKSIRELVQQIFTSYMEQHLGEQISQVGSRPLFGYPGHHGSHSFPAIMVEILIFFLFNFDSGVNALLYTDLLSQNILVGPSVEIPNIRNLYQSASTNSVDVLKAMNSLDNVLVSEVFCCLLHHCMSALLTNNRTLVWDLLVVLLPTWSTSTKQCVDTTFPP